MYDLSNFVQELEHFVTSAHSYREIIDAGANSMRNLLSNRELISNDFINGLLSGTERPLVYKSDKNKFIVQVFVWESGSETPVHDHDTWGLMGIYQNKLRVSEYDLKPIQNSGSFSLDETQNYIASEGDVCYVLPPHEEIHKISNNSGSLSISIHVYGKTIDEYNIYDLANGQVIHTTV